MKIHFDICWQIETETKQQIDADLFALLSGIQHSGSLKQAAEQRSISYRHAWGLIQKWESYFQQALIIKQRGRGATLTAAGEALVNAQNQLNAKFTPSLNNFALQLSQQLDKVLLASKQTSLRIFASHGLAINALFDLVTTESHSDYELHYHGSLESLKALQRQDCEIAGFHLPTGALGQQLLPEYRALLPAKNYTLISVVKRNQGLIIHPQIADKIAGLRSLSDNNIQFINRQVGSGTRLLFDLLLQQHQIKPSRINGYNHEEHTHLAVAAMIKSGVADVGFGIKAVAEKFDLAYQSLVWENYCLAVPNALLADKRIQHIIAVLKSDLFTTSLAHYTGYQLDTRGQTVKLEQLVA